MRTRCLVIGASGQLGRALCAEFRSQHEVIEAVHRSPKPGQWRIDLGDPAGSVATIRDLRPDWILIAGAYCNVDGAETERARCFSVNAEGPEAIAESARAQGGTVVYFSTDTVFDGTAEVYAEADPVAPLNLYSRSKVEGERAVRTLLPDQHLIIRTAWLYGPDEARKNFVFRLTGELRAGRQVPVPADQWGSPTYTDDLAAATRVLIEQGCRGTFHATGLEFVDRVTFARRICATFGLDDRGIVPTPTHQLGQVARRPLRIWLDCQKLRSAGAAEFRGVDAGLTALRSSHLAVQEV